MGINYFTDEQVKTLSNNKYVLRVSNKAITYSEEFKELFVFEYENGLTPSMIFSKYGFDPMVIGRKRIQNCSMLWRKQSQRPDGLTDTRKINSGRPRKKELSDEENIKRLKAKITILEQENAYLKKIRLIEKGALRKAQRDKNTN